MNLHHALAHHPIGRPRPGHLGEQVFAEQWQALMRDPDGIDDDGPPLARIIASGRPTLRRSRVAASFVCWLGTNCGIALLYKAEQLRQKGMPSPMLCAWTLHNRRQIGHNEGIRTVEVVLARETDYGRRHSLGCIGWGLVRLPSYSADDLETIEHVCAWLDESEGREFVRNCEAALEQAGRAQRHARFKAATTGQLPGGAAS